MTLKVRIKMLTKEEVMLNLVQFDITEQKEVEENLRLSEEEYRLAVEDTGLTICRYNIKKSTLLISTEAAKRLSLPVLVEGVPYSRVKLGKISKSTAKVYVQFYEDIKNGKPEGVVIFEKLLPNGWRWIKAHATTIFDNDKKPVSAIISYIDITEEQEKDAVYRIWQQTLNGKNDLSYTLYRCNLNKITPYETVEGNLLKFSSMYNDKQSFMEKTHDFVNECVIDRDIYLNFVDSKKMLLSYHKGKRYDELEFRCKISNNEYHWVRLTVELVQYPNSVDIQAFMLYEDINNEKTTEERIIKQAETDQLTGLLNRSTFKSRLEKQLSIDKIGAFFFLDLDKFKSINDTFGHVTGDEVLINVANMIKSVIRKEDIACRLGGDEFIIFINNFTSIDEIEDKAKLICEAISKPFDSRISISASLGIAVTPKDGMTFEVLYENADKAQYHIKNNGKNSYCFYEKK